MTPQEIEKLKKALPTMAAQEKLAVLDLLEEYEKRKFADKCRNSLLSFVLHIHPDYKIGAHHKILASKLEAAARGDILRLATALAPRFGKSLLLSLYFPAWFMGNFPAQKLIISSHTADLAIDFGRKVRNLMATPEYKQIFPEVELATDSKSAGSWATSKGGSFFAVGVGGAVAGRGGDLCVSLDTTLNTPAGAKKAKDVQVGDFVYGSDGFGRVKAKVLSTHNSTVEIDGLKMSPSHPVWTANRGWVEAEKITTADVLQTSSFWVKFKLFLTQRAQNGHFGQALQARAVLRQDVQHLGNDAATLHKPQRSQLRKLWGAGYLRGPSLGQVLGLLRGHGGPAFGLVYAGQKGCSRELLQRELPLGLRRDAAEQQAQFDPLDWLRQNNVDEAVEPGAWNRVLAAAASGKDNGAGHRGSSSHAEGEPRSVSGRLLHACRQAAYRLLGVTRCYGEGYRHRQTDSPFVFVWAQQVLQGAFLGLRQPRRIRRSAHEARDFCNFHVEGHNTFVADDVLTHNCIIDDPFSEQDVLNGNYAVFDRVYDWYTYGLRTRLMPGGRVVALHTRWAKNDLIGRLVEDAAKDPEKDQWEYIEFPAIIGEHTPEEKSLWPAQWSIEELRRTRATMPAFQWNAQYQQSPTGVQGAIIKPDWWRRWTKEDPPTCEYILMTLDAAQEVNKRADYTALAVWGVFYQEMDDGEKRANIILLNCVCKRIEFPELKKLALSEFKFWKPDCFIIEKKSNGAALAQELRRMGLPLQEYSPNRGTANSPNNKFARLTSVADIVMSGLVWAPELKWADEFIEECNDFPAGKHDDRCFIAGTRILMADGSERRIESIDVGSYVRTPEGVGRVVSSGCSGVAKTFRVCAGGSVLEGTGAHPVATQNGWKRLDTLTMADTIKMSSTFKVKKWLSRLNPAPSLNLLFLTATSTIATLMPNRFPIVGTTHDVAGIRFTELYGSSTTALSKKDSTFTTKTKIGITTLQKILSAFPRSNILAHTAKKTTSATKALSSWRTWLESARRLQNGTVALKVSSGTENVQNESSPQAALRNKQVQRQGRVGRRTQKQGLAWSAARVTRRLLLSLSSALIRARVETVEPTNERKLVYNLTVEGSKCYYANGVLVHNCDNLIMALTRFRSGGFIALPSDDEYDDHRQFVPRRAAYY